jgi:hypothetical protein
MLLAAVWHSFFALFTLYTLPPHGSQGPKDEQQKGKGKWKGSIGGCYFCEQLNSPVYLLFLFIIHKVCAISTNDGVLYASGFGFCIY